MDKLPSIILAAWLRVPRWFKQGVLVSITIFFFYMCFVKGLTSGTPCRLSLWSHAPFVPSSSGWCG